MDVLARKIRNEYARNWRAKNKDKCKEIQRRYWERKADALKDKENNCEQSQNN